MPNIHLPPPKVIPWAEEDMPHGQRVDPAESRHPSLPAVVFRSFRSDLRHKVEVALLAHGGYGRGGVRRLASVLGVHPQTVRHWLHWKAMPSVSVAQRLDDVYVEALDSIAQRKESNRAKRRRRTPRERPLEELLQEMVDARGL